MILVQEQPTTHSCLPTAFAIILGIPARQIIRELGHDGTEIVFPKAEGRWSFKGWHPQELVTYCWANGWSVTRFDRTYGSRNSTTDETYFYDEYDLRSVMLPSVNGVAVTRKHAYAFADGWLIDPKDGEKIYLHDKIDKLVSFYAVSRRKMEDDLR